MTPRYVPISWEGLRRLLLSRIVIVKGETAFLQQVISFGLRSDVVRSQWVKVLYRMFSSYSH